MPHQFTPHQFVLDTWRTDVRGSDFGLLTLGPTEEALDNPVLNAGDVFLQRHMVHCSALAVTVDNEELPSRLACGTGGRPELVLRSERWPPPQADPLLAELDADVLECMPAAHEDRPSFVWLSAAADDSDAAALAGNVRSFFEQQVQHAAAGAGGAVPSGMAEAVASFAAGECPAAAHPTMRHPSWPSDHELAFELAATHAAAVAGSSPPFAGDAPGGPLQLEARLEEVVRGYAAARGCKPEQVQLVVLGTRQSRERRQHLLVACAETDGGLAHVFDQPLVPVASYNLRQQQEAGEVVVQPDSDGRGLIWWLQSSMAPVPPEQERTLPWKTFLNLDPAAAAVAPRGADAVAVAAHSLGNNKYDALDVAFYFPAADTELRVPVSRVLLRRADALRPCKTGSVPRQEEARGPSLQALERLAAAGVPLQAAPELVMWLREEGREEALAAIEAAGGLRKASPRKTAPPASPVA